MSVAVLTAGLLLEKWSMSRHYARLIGLGYGVAATPGGGYVTDVVSKAVQLRPSDG